MKYAENQKRGPEKGAEKGVGVHFHIQLQLRSLINLAPGKYCGYLVCCLRVYLLRPLLDHIYPDPFLFFSQTP